MREKEGAQQNEAGAALPRRGGDGDGVSQRAPLRRRDGDGHSVVREKGEGEKKRQVRGRGEEKRCEKMR